MDGSRIKSGTARPRPGIYVCRDSAGDRAYSLWTVEPVLSDGEWVPEKPTHGRSIYAAVAVSFAAAVLGRRLRPGQIAFVLTAINVRDKARST